MWRGRLKALSVPFFIWAAFSAGNYRPYDVLISSDMSLAGVWNEAGEVVVSSGRKETFTAEKWVAYYGREGDAPLVWPKEGAAHGVVGDGDACRFEGAAQKVSFVFKVGAAAQECLWADVVIVFDYGPRRGCEQGGVPMIDQRTARKEGAHGLLLNRDGSFIIETDLEKRGSRPWVNL